MLRKITCLPEFWIFFFISIDKDFSRLKNNHNHLNQITGVGKRGNSIFPLLVGSWAEVEGRCGLLLTIWSLTDSVVSLPGGKTRTLEAQQLLHHCSLCVFFILSQSICICIFPY